MAWLKCLRSAGRLWLSWPREVPCPLLTLRRMLTLSSVPCNVVAKCAVTSHMNSPIDDCDYGESSARAPAPIIESRTASQGSWHALGAKQKAEDRQSLCTARCLCSGLCACSSPQQLERTLHLLALQPRQVDENRTNRLTAIIWMHPQEVCSEGQHFTGGRILTAVKALSKGKQFAFLFFQPSGSLGNTSQPPYLPAHCAIRHPDSARVFLSQLQVARPPRVDSQTQVWTMPTRKQVTIHKATANVHLPWTQWIEWFNLY